MKLALAFLDPLFISPLSSKCASSSVRPALPSFLPSSARCIPLVTRPIKGSRNDHAAAGGRGRSSRARSPSSAGFPTRSTRSTLHSSLASAAIDPMSMLFPPVAIRARLPPASCSLPATRFALCLRAVTGRSLSCGCCKAAKKDGRRASKARRL